MAIQIKCDDCGKRYKLADAAAGKRGKCRNCGNVFTIPAPGARQAETAPLVAVEAAVDRPAGGARRSGSRQMRTAPPADLGFNLKELADLERTGTVDDEYQLAPLAPPPLETAQTPARPRPMPIGVTQRRPEAQSSSLGTLTRFGPWVALGLFVLLVGGMTLLSGSVAAGILAALAITGLAVSLGGSIWLVTIPFRESLAYGLMYLFVPFYGFYYLITRWDDMKRPLVIAAMGWLLLVVVGLLAPS